MGKKTVFTLFFFSGWLIAGQGVGYRPEGEGYFMVFLDSCLYQV